MARSVISSPQWIQKVDRQLVVVAERGNASAAHLTELPRELEPPFNLTSVDRSLEQEEAQLATSALVERQLCRTVDVELEVPGVVDLDDAPVAKQI